MKQLMMAMVLVCGAALITGCETTETAEREITKEEVLADMSPRLTHLSRTHWEAQITQKRTVDTNGRMFWDALEEVLLLDRPSRLTMYPAP